VGISKAAGENALSNRSAKGSSFERSFCKKLSLWWTNNASDEIFWRTSQSGGRSTTRAKAGKSTNYNHCGDIGAIDESGADLIRLITWEMKKGYNSTQLGELLDRSPHAKEQQWEEWIRKAEEASKRAGSYGWFLVHQRDRREAIMVMPWEVWTEFRAIGSLQLDRADKTLTVTSVMAGSRKKVIGFPLERFWVTVTPEHIRKLALIHL